MSATEASLPWFDSGGFRSERKARQFIEIVEICKLFAVAAREAP